jgi:methylmalonyl-CoA carboxyltransferase large subunit
VRAGEDGGVTVATDGGGVREGAEAMAATTAESTGTGPNAGGSDGASPGAARPVSMDERIGALRERLRILELGGGPTRIEKQHASGKLTARERIAALADPDSFVERNAFARHRCTDFGMADKELPADGVVTGSAAVGGRLVHVASQDFTVAGGAAGEVHSDKIVEMMKASLKTGSPFVFINDSGGARIQEGIDSLAAYGRVFFHNTLLSGVVPQISLICGPCAGGAAYSPALTDFIIQTKKARMFITGPQVIQRVTGEEISAEQLGGTLTHTHYSGVVHFEADDDRHAVEICQKLLSYLPSNNMEDAPARDIDPVIADDPGMNGIVPVNPREPYGVHAVIERIVDDGDFLEIQSRFAANIVIGFGRVMGRTVGVVANNAAQRAGVLDIDSSDKASRFVRFCNAFSIPIVTLVDVPGFLPGVEQEYHGIIRHGAKLLFAYSACTVPKVTVILRKAYGGAYVAMGSKELGADAVAAWPGAEIAVMGAEGAIEVIFRKEIEAAEDKKKARAEFASIYRDKFASPYVAAGRRMIDSVIEPAETRRYIATALEAMRTKRELRPEKKHGLMPM